MAEMRYLFLFLLAVTCGHGNVAAQSALSSLQQRLQAEEHLNQARLKIEELRLVRLGFAKSVMEATTKKLTPEQEKVVTARLQMDMQQMEAKSKALFAQTEALVRKAQTIKPGYGPAHIFLGIACQQMGYAERRQQEFEKAVRLIRPQVLQGPADDIYLRYLMTAYMELKQFQQAEQDLNTYARRFPGNKAAQNTVAGQRQELQQARAKAAKDNKAKPPAKPTARTPVKPAPSPAVSSGKKMLEPSPVPEIKHKPNANPRQRADMYLEHALSRMEAYNQSLSKSGGKPTAESTKLAGEALTYCIMAQREIPTYGAAYLLKGMVFKAYGDDLVFRNQMDLAIRNLRPIVLQSPPDNDSAGNLVDAYLQLGRYEQARRDLNAYAKRFPDDPNVQGFCEAYLKRIDRGAKPAGK